MNYILFTDETQYHRDGTTSTRSLCPWSHDDPHDIVHSDCNTSSVNVWCGIVKGKGKVVPVP
jgi:hypothetical protein